MARCAKFWALSLATTLTLSLAPALVHAGARQVHGGPLSGGALLLGTDLSLGGAISGQLGYGLSDAFRVYGTLEVPITAGLQNGRALVAPGLSAGVAYTLDVLSVVPWIGLEARGHLVLSPTSGVTWLAGGGARVGVDWLATRYLGLTVQGAYSACWFDNGLAHLVNVSVGARWTLDL
jgi:hypothetical protein